jgi:amidase
MQLGEYASYDATGLAELVIKGEVSASELAQLALDGIAKLNPDLNAVIETYPQRALPEYLNGIPKGPFYGVPFLNKDLSFPEKGSLFEMGAQLLKGNIAGFDGLAIERLRNAGFVNLGRTTTPEFGLVGVTESRMCGITRNPWDLTRTPSGSSGGSAAAVISGIVPFATASDGGGSIRGPAANCGLIGLKTTRGRIPLTPRAESNSGLGVIFGMTKSVRDTAALLDILQGTPHHGALGLNPPKIPYVDELNTPMGQLRIAYTHAIWGYEEISDEVTQSLDDVLKHLEEEGHIVEQTHPEVDYEKFLDATLTVWSTNLAASVINIVDTSGQQADVNTLQSSTLAMLEYGQSISAIKLLDATTYFAELSDCVEQFFNGYDLLITPSSATTARKVGEFDCDSAGHVDIEDWNRAIYLYDGYYPLYNSSGHPAVSLPIAHSSDDLPISIQFAAAMGNEALLIRIASYFEQARPWSARKPKVHVSNVTTS